MATTLDTRGPFVMEGERDEESGHRTYRVVLRVIADSKFDGPAQVMQTPGLPLPGSVYAFGNDLDVYAWCRPGQKVRRARGVRESGPVRYWDVETVFSTRPAAIGGGTSSGRPGSSGGGRSGNRQGCHDGRVEDPLLEPQGVSGSWLKKVEEATHDAYGVPILTSSWERVSGGSGAEFEEVNPTVSIEQNVPALQLDLCSSMMNTLNDATLWGLPARTWRLADFDWERKYHGLCYPYYVRRFKFEASYRWVVDEFTGITTLLPSWDRVVQDYGQMALKGHWGTGRADEGTGWVLDSVDDVVLTEPDPLRPGDFARYRDRDGNYTAVVLDGMGSPFDPGDSTRSFHWLYVFGPPGSETVVSIFDTYNNARAQSVLGGGPEDPEVAEVYGPFPTAAQANAAAAESDLFTSSRYRGWSGQNAFPAPGRIKIVKHTASNFYLLGIPAVL